ncbi:aldolase/citrate lyase family protein [Haladaptatus sp. DJG-WS-42]|uniref:HpcH/HpaI aldolase family protein n=1 Tax=Haladaptatus sp. DJG-WS-42 TaxID=3120516 RepID=UPI0030CED373
MTADLRAALRAREPVCGSWISLADPAVAEATASLDYEFLLIDTEHAPHSVETVTDLVRGVDAAPGDTEPFVRAAWNDPVRIKRLLDVGVAGIMVPMLESRADAEAFVSATRYPPEGERGIAASRAAQYGLDFEEYVARANEELVTIGQIESRDGLDAVEEIVTVPGLDALFIGPADLSGALSVFGEWDSDELREAIETVLSTAHAHDVPVGTLASTNDQIDDWLALGFDYLIAGIDVSHMLAGSVAAKERFDNAMAER